MISERAELSRQHSLQLDAQRFAGVVEMLEVRRAHFHHRLGVLEVTLHGVEALDGLLIVTSPPGAGTVVTAELPLAVR